MAAAVGRDAIDPTPESGGLPQFGKAAQHDDQHILGGILGVLFFFQHLFAVIIHFILHRLHQGLLGLFLPLDASADQFLQLFLIDFHRFPLLLQKWPGDQHIPFYNIKCTGYGIKKKPSGGLF